MATASTFYLGMGVREANSIRQGTQDCVGRQIQSGRWWLLLSDGFGSGIGLMMIDTVNDRNGSNDADTSPAARSSHASAVTMSTKMGGRKGLNSVHWQDLGIGDLGKVRTSS